MGTVEFSPVVGAYVPHGSPVSESLGCLTIGDMSCRASRRQNIAIAVGGRATAWVNRWIALEGSVWYAASPVTADTSTTRSGRFLLHQTYDAPARVVAGNVRVLVSLVRGAGAWAYVVGGPAFVGRFGDAYAAETGMTRVGGVVGVGAHLRLARSVALRAEVEDYLYSVQGYHQQDFILSVGLSLASRIRSTATP
jgi:hypothetical protein